MSSFEETIRAAKAESEERQAKARLEREEALARHDERARAAKKLLDDATDKILGEALLSLKENGIPAELETKPGGTGLMPSRTLTLGGVENGRRMPVRGRVNVSTDGSLIFITPVGGDPSKSLRLNPDEVESHLREAIEGAIKQYFATS